MGKGKGVRINPSRRVSRGPSDSLPEIFLFPSNPPSLLGKGGVKFF